jgi:enoyl-CoA hydratase/carnithine racemase
MRLTLARPERRNALNGELCHSLVDTLEAAGRDPSVGAILMTGNGKSFCAGMDLHEAAGGITGQINAAHERLFTVGARLTKPLVAAVDGAALGGGAGLVANCHIVIAGGNATFGLTEIRLGLWPFLVYRAVAAALGERRALELALTGRIFGAEEARDIGLVHEIAPDAEKRGLEVAESVAGFSPTAIQLGMNFVQEVRDEDSATSGQIARRMREQVFAGADFQEGVKAFREKRLPRWPSLVS